MPPVTLLSLIALVAVAAAVYFAYDGLRKSATLFTLEGENADLRVRVAELAGEVRLLRGGGGLPAVQSVADELMPLRQAGRAAARPRPARPAENPQNTVVFIGNSVSERDYLEAELTTHGYRFVSAASAADAQTFAHELTTAVLLFDLRDSIGASVAQTVGNALRGDPMAREVPLFALVSSTKERDRLLEEGNYAAVFVTPTDTALLLSNLGATMIRRKTRVARAQVARSIATAART